MRARSAAALTLALAALAAPQCRAPDGARAAAAPGARSFDELFTGRTLRVDYQHFGNADEERVGLEGWRLEGEWAGSRTELVDDSGMGKYHFRVLEGESGALLWSRGFASIYGEWETTGEAREAWRGFRESQRFPEPRRALRVELAKRAADGALATIWTAAVEPEGRAVDRSALGRIGSSAVILESGPPATKVDLLVLGEGYTAEQAQKFQGDAGRLVEVLLATEPFASRRSDFNVRTLHVPSVESGVSNPRKGVWRDSPLGLSYNAFDSDRYVLTWRDRELRDAAAQLPYDALILLFNERKYGGGGIYNLWATCAADTAPAAYVFVHEFGHSFAGLADEYYSSQVAYEDFVEPGTEPWEPNVTALLDPARLKWRHLVEPGTPLPTPWDKQAYDALDLEYQAKRAALLERQAGDDEVEALFAEVKSRTGPMLASDRWAGRVGAFEGAAYESRGLYRPEVDCIMFTRNPTHFCRVCSEAVERAIDRYTR